MFKKSEIFKTRKSTIFSVGGVTSNPQVQSVPANSNCCTSEKEMRTNPSIIPQGTNPFPKNNGVFAECCSETTSIVGDYRFIIYRESFTGFGLAAELDVPITVDWGDGETETFTGTGNYEELGHTYSADTEYATINVVVSEYSAIRVSQSQGLGSDDSIREILAFSSKCVAIKFKNQSGLLAIPTVGLFNCTYFELDNCINVAEIETTNLSACETFLINRNILIGNLSTVGLVSCAIFEARNIDNLILLETQTMTLCNSFNASNNPALDTIDVFGLTTCSDFRSADCPQLLEITNSSTGFMSVANIDIGNCALPESNINDILVAINNSSVFFGTGNTVGQTPAAVPSGAGAIAKAAMILNGWTWTTD